MAAYTTIDDPTEYFQIALYTGTGSTQSITNDGNSDLQPDWVWVKKRDAAESNALADSSRGTSATLFSDLNNQESSCSQVVNSFNSDGFQVGTEGVVNDNTNTYVAWQWKAGGGTTSTNSDGDINSTVQVNSTAGFSIITDSPGNNTARTIGHGLGAKPDFIIRRARNRTEDWCVYHSAFESTLPGGFQGLNTTAAYNDSATTLFTSVSNTTFGVGTDFGVNGGFNYVTYAFKEVQGYSKFGKYIGNGNSDGPFIYTGFKPAFIMTKRSDTAGYHWRIYDAKRNPFNIVNARLSANNNDAEYSGTSGNEHCDFLSNGWKWKTNASDQNVDGGTYIYMAFEENPFVTSNGIPTTAR